MKLYLHFSIAAIVLTLSFNLFSQSLNSPFLNTSNAFIDSVYPKQNSSYFPSDGTIKIFFSQPMNAATVNSTNILLFGSLTGKYDYSVIYQSGTNTAEIQSTNPLKLGELISITLDSFIQTSTGTNIIPFVFTFNVKPEIGSVKFAVADSFQLNFSPTSITSADFNNDGHIDVIASNYDSSKYTIALNNGSGHFSIGEVMSGVFKPVYCVFTDIDNDRDVDMIVPTNEENKIQIYKNTGQGVFNYTTPITVSAPIGICPGDFDGDGYNDFVALCNTGNATFYKNNGSGVFVESGSAVINVPATIRNVVGDIDNDGDLDILGGTSDYNGVFKILVNDGNGNFTFTGGPYLGPYPDELAGGDMDGDYDLDFIKCDWYQNGIGIGINNGFGEFPVEDFLNLGNVGGQSRNPIANDFDGDGDLDFVVAFNGSNVGIAKNNGFPNFELYLSYLIPGIKGLTAADFDGNGSVDLAVISSTTNQIKFLKNCVDGLVAYYPFAGDTKDYSGNVNEGINYNGVFEKDRYGNDIASMFFNGVDSYVEGINPGNNLPAGNSRRTFSAWIRNYEYHQYGSNIFHYGTAEAAPTNFHFLITDVLGLGNGYGFGVVYGNTNLIDSTWHFVTGVYEGGTERITKLYIDGKLDTSGVITSEPNTILSNNWKIGQFIASGTPFKGNIDELKVYNVALSDQEIWDMYKATTTAPTLLYPDDNSTINTLTPLFDWDSLVTAINYQISLGTDSAFNNIVLTETINQSHFQIASGLLTTNTDYYWKVRTVNDGGVGPWSEVFTFDVNLSDVEDEKQLPSEFRLLQNYPNPFNPNTVISYQLPVGSNVTLKVYDILGNEVATLVNDYKSAGEYEIEFNAVSTSHDLSLTSGIYFYQLKGGSIVQTKKMVFIK